MAGGIIFDIMKYAIHDGPGIRTTVFLKGCPLRCQWCHNPESQAVSPQLMLFPERCIGCGRCKEVCPTGAVNTAGLENCRACGECSAVCNSTARELVGRKVKANEVLREIDKDLIFYDESGGGVTFSGGEPLAQSDFLRELLEGCREWEIHTAVETTGFTSTEKLSALADLVDLWLYDLKLMDDTRHSQVTGVSNRQVLANLQWLAGQGARIIVRIPLIPGINDDDANILASAEFLTGIRIPEVHVLPYHQAGVEKYRRLNREYAIKNTEVPSEERLAKVAALLSGYGLKVKIGG